MTLIFSIGKKKKRIAGAHRTEYLKWQAVEAKMGGWNCPLEYRGKGI